MSAKGLLQKQSCQSELYSANLTAVKPFLKWAGSKFRIIKQIKTALEALPNQNRFIEPFVGSAAVFMNTDYGDYHLNDSNSDLIGLYRILQQDGPSFIQYCKSFFTPENHHADKYYELRHLFNASTDPYLKSALFLYLNRHGFNGLCRYNAQGQFNVPFGRYKKPYFPELEMLAFYQKASQATFYNQDFLQIMQSAQPGDVVYCDPPYVPLSSTASFTDYSAGGFSMAQQEQLADLAKTLSERGVHVLISNHCLPITETLYEGADITSLSVQRFISCHGDNRQKALELLALFVGKDQND
jgi:DNA adenine methylase